MANRCSLPLLATLCVLALSGCGQSEQDWLQRFADTDYPNLDTVAEVQRVVSQATSSSRAIMFVHVDWAIMEPRRTRFAEFALAYLQHHPDHPVDFYYVDCTPVTHGYAPLRALDGWKELEDSAGVSLIQGWGELVWMENGRVLHVEPILSFNSTSHLIKQTERLMPPPRRG